MTDEWEFRTVRGRGSVADGKLRVENSLAGMARGHWVERERKERFVFLFSTLTTLAGLYRLADAGRALAVGRPRPWHLLVLAAFAFVALALVRRARRTRTIPLRRVRSVYRTDDERVRVVYAERDDADRDDAERDLADFEIETLTGADADDAVEMLQLKGVEFETGRGPKPKSRTFRERLAKKIE